MNEIEIERENSFDNTYMDENLTRLLFVRHRRIEIRKRENDSSRWMSYLRAEDWKRSIHREGKRKKSNEGFIESNDGKGKREKI